MIVNPVEYGSQAPVLWERIAKGESIPYFLAAWNVWYQILSSEMRVPSGDISITRKSDTGDWHFTYRRGDIQDVQVQQSLSLFDTVYEQALELRRDNRVRQNLDLFGPTNFQQRLVRHYRRSLIKE